MEHDQTGKRQLAATLAIVLTMSQANAAFPLIAVGLNIWVLLLTSLVGGLAAASLTYYLFARSVEDTLLEAQSGPNKVKSNLATLDALKEEGVDALKLVAEALPILLLTVILVKALDSFGVVSLAVNYLSPSLQSFGLSGIAPVLFLSKYLAGGTAMMGAALNLIQEGAMTTVELNRLAGFLVNPLDAVGLAVLISPGPRIKSVKGPAILGALAGVFVRGILHLLIF